MLRTLDSYPWAVEVISAGLLGGFFDHVDIQASLEPQDPLYDDRDLQAFLGSIKNHLEFQSRLSIDLSKQEFIDRFKHLPLADDSVDVSPFPNPPEIQNPLRRTLRSMVTPLVQSDLLQLQTRAEPAGIKINKSQ